MTEDVKSPAPHMILVGVAIILATAFTISVQDVVFKLYSSEMTLWQIFALRGCIAVPLLIAFILVRSSPIATLQSAVEKWVVLRSVFITGTFLAFYAAIPFLSLSTIGAANYMAPIFIALLSALVIKEPVRLIGWIGVCLGFAGVLVLLQPGTDAYSPWALLPIGGAMFYALAHVITRTKCQDVPLPAIALSQNFAMLIAGLLVSILIFIAMPRGEVAEVYPYIFGTWSVLEAKDWLVLILLAGFSIIIAVMLAGAYKVAPPALVSTFEYSYLVFAATWDILLFGIILNNATILGMIMIAAAGLFVLYGNARR